MRKTLVDPKDIQTPAQQIIENVVLVGEGKTGCSREDWCQEKANTDAVA